MAHDCIECELPCDCGDDDDCAICSVCHDEHGDEDERDWMPED